MTTYQLSHGDRTLEHDFPQLCFRLKQLEDRMISYLLRGETSCLVSYSFERTKTACFAWVTFDETLAEKYEASMQKFFETKKNRQTSELPRPKFTVEIGITFVGGQTEQFSFPFREYSDERVLLFCKEVEERSVYLFRHRFSKNK